MNPLGMIDLPKKYDSSFILYFVVLSIFCRLKDIYYIRFAKLLDRQSNIESFSIAIEFSQLVPICWCLFFSWPDGSYREISENIECLMSF